MNKQVTQIYKIIRHKIRDKIQDKPSLYLTYCSLRPNLSGTIVNKETDILIHAFPRSANTFAERAFKYAQEKNVKVAHHIHAPAQVMRAVRNEIPTLVIVRNPKDAITSLLSRHKKVRVCTRVRDYIRYYEAILPYKQGCVIEPFESITKDFGKSIKRVNKRFNTSFNIFEHKKENVEKIYDKEKSLGQIR